MDDNTEKVKQFRKRADKKIALVKDYKQVFATQAGKRVLEDLIATHYVLRPLFHPDNPHATSLNEGERNVVLRILSKLGTNPLKMREMVEEQIRSYEYAD